MKQKDFDTLAGFLKDIRSYAMIMFKMSVSPKEQVAMCRAVGDQLRGTYPEFDYKRFYYLCGLPGYQEVKPQPSPTDTEPQP